MPIAPSSSSRRIVLSERTTGRFYDGLSNRAGLQVFHRRTSVRAPVSMLFEPLEPNERFRARRETARRRIRRRRRTAAAILLGGVASVALGAKVITGEDAQRAAATTAGAATPTRATPVLAPMPDEVRGIHVTMGLASLPGKLDEYLALQDDGLNTIQLDIKDENGEVGFIPSARRSRTTGLGPLPACSSRRAST